MAAVPSKVVEPTGPPEGDGGTKAKKSGIGRGKYIVIRALLIIPTVFILVTTVFVLMRLTGDPVSASVGGRLPPEQLAERIHAAGYDRPIIIQYLDYLGGILRGDFGDRKSTRLNSSHVSISYAVFCLKKKKK